MVAGEQPAIDTAPISLWRHTDFLKLWIGQTISVFGSQFTNLALPLIAVIILAATPEQIGLLGALESVPFLLIGLFVGVWVDRYRRRRILILADVARGTLIGLIALTTFAAVLRIESLYVIGFLLGVSTVFFDVAYQAYIPSLVERHQIVEANSRLETSNSAAVVAGPGLAGALIQAASAAFAIVIDSVSFFVSAFSLLIIQKQESIPERGQRRSMAAEAKEGLGVVFGDRRLWSIAGCTSTFNLLASAFFTLYILFLVRVLGLEPLAIGFAFAIAAIGGLLGAVLAARIAKAIGLGRTIIVAISLGSLGLVVVLFATPSFAVPLIIAGQFLTGFSTLVYNINQVSLRQAITPLRLQGRMNATMRFLVWGTLPAGSLLGGFLGGLVGIREAITLAAVASFVAVPWVVFSPVRQLRTIPTAGA